MSYQIYYDRAFIRVGDKFIPLVNSGSNNCWDFKGGREVPEKDWGVLNWKRRDRLCFTETEIREIARDYEQNNQESGMDFKSRNRCFDSGEFERWIVNGLNNAYTIEEYVSFGNGFYIFDYSPKETKDWKRYPFRTTDEFLSILKGLTSNFIALHMDNNREVYRPKSARAARKKLRAADLPEYYVLKGDYKGRTVYFTELTRRGGARFIWDVPGNLARVFPTEKAANKYLEKYHDRLRDANFEPELRINAA